MNTGVPSFPKLALIGGPTASGKSAYALRLAEQRGGTIINADSAQVYRDLRVLSARPSAAEEARVPHRLFGHVDAAEPYSAARWASEARAAVEEAWAAGRLPILVGGTGLYLRTLIEGIAPVPAIPDVLRDAVRVMPVAEAFAALSIADPAAAARLRPSDTTRVARALEVVRATGRPLSHWQRQRSGGIGDAVDLDATLILPDRAPLFARCDTRFASMLANGALEEVRRLAERHDVPANAPVRRAIGVPELTQVLAGTLTVSEAADAARLATRRYAKRQYTWFRHQPPASWRRVHVFGEDLAPA